MSKQNVSEGFRQKVKQFFGVKKGNVISSSVYEGPKPDEFYFHQELLQVQCKAVLLCVDARSILRYYKCVFSTLNVLS